MTRVTPKSADSRSSPSGEGGRRPSEGGERVIITTPALEAADAGFPLTLTLPWERQKRLPRGGETPTTDQGWLAGVFHLRDSEQPTFQYAKKPLPDGSGFVKI